VARPVLPRRFLERIERIGRRDVVIDQPAALPDRPANAAG